MDHLLRRVGLDPTLSTIMRTILQGNSQVNFPQFLGSLPCTKRSIERHFFFKPLSLDEPTKKLVLRRDLV